MTIRIVRRCPWCHGEIVELSTADLFVHPRWYCTKCDSVILREKMSDFEMKGRKKVPQ